MPSYGGVSMDWKINTYVKSELVKCWINTEKIRISTVKGVVHLKGVLQFVGRAQDDANVPVLVIGVLKKLELAINSIRGVKGVQFELKGWKKSGGRWTKQGKGG